MNGPAATGPQLTKLAVCFDAAGVPKRDRERRLALCAAFVRRSLTSSAELSRDDAHRLIELLECDPLAIDRLQRLVDAGQPGPAAAAPAPARTGGQPGDGDLVVQTTQHSDADQPSVEAGWTPIKRGPGCWPDGLHWVPPGEGTRYCRCFTVTQVPSRDRYCAPSRCYCGRCPGYVPLDDDGYSEKVRNARASLFEKDRQARERRTRLQR